jgi:NhaP-type Na+/H+ or K+/H+ antiporter
VAIRDGFVGVAATLLVYGVTELVWGYGFIAVFVTAITLRNYELDHKYHRKLHDFTEQIERILVAIMLLLFGGLLVHGILASLNQTMVWLSLLFVLLLRPLTGLVVMLREKFNLKEKLAISFFGIRGMGSLFYLSFALEKGTFKQEKALWAIVSFIIVLSLLIHGFTAGTVIQKLEEEAEAQEAEDRQKDEGEKKRIKEPKK